MREPKPHGYRAIQLAFGEAKEAKLTRPVAGQFKKSGTGTFRHIREFRVPTSGTSGQAGAEPASQEAAGEWKVGQQFTVQLFQENELVDVTGISIGKGFQGGMKRWHWRGGPKTHGSTSHRAPGSIGSTTTPGRVWRGHHLPGHMGADRVTVQNLRVVRLDLENNLLLVHGAVPGAEDGLLLIRKSVKRPGFIKKPQAIQTVVEEEEATSKKAKPGKK
jgi:large subunit ribosomal protein L3